MQFLHKLPIIDFISVSMRAICFNIRFFCAASSRFVCSFSFQEYFLTIIISRLKLKFEIDALPLQIPFI